MAAAKIFKDRMNTPQFIVSAKTLHKKEIHLDSGEHFHMVRVRRLEPGSLVRLVDGLGSLAHARIRQILPEGVVLERSGPVESADDSVPLEVILAIIKGERMDLSILQLSEIGIRQIQPVITSRTIVRPDPSRLARKWERWQALSLHGLKQCRGIRATKVLKPRRVEEALPSFTKGGERIIFCQDHQGTGLLDILKGQGLPLPVVTAIGPEGGFSREEIGLFVEHGFKPAGLGPRILRSGTAAVYSAAVISEYLRGMDKA
jgi:16S rRNA (uracil1498-N3)-methyltransferase